ncbi:MAG: IS6 family transposase [Proteobacteria bacterium]|nr:IS6 family transposase [Pseudomonadota bacterium]
MALWRLRYKFSLRDLSEMFLLRGIVFSYEAVRDWKAKLPPTLADSLRRRRRCKAGRSWYVNETYLKVQGATPVACAMGQRIRPPALQRRHAHTDLTRDKLDRRTLRRHSRATIRSLYACPYRATC